MASTSPRKTISIYDYPEHLNPFREEDNHNKIRFWTIGRKLNRSNSITFSGIKDLKNSWALRSFMRKDKKDKAIESPKLKTHQANGETSPIQYRRGLNYSSTSNTTGSRTTVGSPERADRYVYGGSVTPLPRSRFQERLRSTSQQEVSLHSTPRMTRSEVSGSRLSVESTNPFDDEPIPPVRAARRKKKRAAPPPPTIPNGNVISAVTQDQNIENKELQTNDLELEDMNLNVELKIVEDQDTTINTSIEANTTTDLNTSIESNTTENIDTNVSKSVNSDINNVSLETVDATDPSTPTNNNDLDNKLDTKNKADSVENILSNVDFQKVDITKYRRNSSINEDDIRLRRGNLEDFHSLDNKRSKSLTNAMDGNYLVYDININEQSPNDVNENQPKKVICKLYEDSSRKKSMDNSVSSTEREFMEIDKATRELEREISKLNTALNEDDDNFTKYRLSVSDIKKRFDTNGNVSSPNPIPKPRRSNYNDHTPPVHGNVTN